MLDRDYPEFEQYVNRYGVAAYPASIIVAPDKTFRVRVGDVPRDQFLAFADKAIASEPGVQRPAPMP